MQSDIKHFPVNWVDGMKISKRHLIEFQNSVNDMIRDSISIGLTDHNYGILPYPNYSGIDCSIVIDHTQRIDIKVNTCKAITPDGTRVQVLPENALSFSILFEQLMKDYNISAADENAFYVVLSVDQFSRVSVGNPSEDEFPPRHPFSIPEYKLSILPSRNINRNSFGSASLIIGKLINQKGVLKADEEFIPASTSLLSHKLLVNYYNSVTGLIASIEKSSFAIIQKINLKEPKLPLANNVLKLVERIVFGLSGESSRLRLTVPSLPAIHLLQSLLIIPHTISFVLSTLSGQEKEVLLEYIGEWSEMSPGIFESKTSILANNFQYTHIDCSESFLNVFDYLKSISDLLSVLSQLEFIGKRKGQSVFIVEHQVNPEPEKPKSRWSPLS
jgi:hypothetical protein